MHWEYIRTTYKVYMGGNYPPETSSEASQKKMVLGLSVGL